MNTTWLAPVCADVAPDSATHPHAPISRRAMALGFDLPTTITTATTNRTNLPTEKGKSPRLLHHQAMTSACNYRCFAKDTRATRNSFALPARIFREMAKSKSLPDCDLRKPTQKGPMQTPLNPAFQRVLPPSSQQTSAKLAAQKLRRRSVPVHGHLLRYLRALLFNT